jgi:hypothetical protein
MVFALLLCTVYLGWIPTPKNGIGCFEYSLSTAIWNGLTGKPVLNISSALGSTGKIQ